MSRFDDEMEAALIADGEKLLALTGEDHGPFCPECLGSGVEVFGITVYEPGCGFSHDSSDERPCPECNGTGKINAAPYPDPDYLRDLRDEDRRMAREQPDDGEF